MATKYILEYTTPASRGKVLKKTFTSTDAREKFIKATPGLKVKAFARENA